MRRQKLTQRLMAPLLTTQALFSQDYPQVMMLCTLVICNGSVVYLSCYDYACILNPLYFLCMFIVDYR